MSRLHLPPGRARSMISTLITEMDEIRSGQWDTKIRADLGIEPEEGEDVSVIDVDAGESVSILNVYVYMFNFIIILAHAEAEREEVEGAKELEDGTLANVRVFVFT